MPYFTGSLIEFATFFFVWRALLEDRRLESSKLASESFAMHCIVHDLDKHKRDTMECYHAVVLQKNVDFSELRVLERASSSSFLNSAVQQRRHGNLCLRYGALPFNGSSEQRSGSKG
jgi:hypothetical protein